jgi:hypothetical protein
LDVDAFDSSVAAADAVEAEVVEGGSDSDVHYLMISDYNP